MTKERDKELSFQKNNKSKYHNKDIRERTYLNEKQICKIPDTYSTYGGGYLYFRAFYHYHSDLAGSDCICKSGNLFYRDASGVEEGYHKLFDLSVDRSCGSSSFFRIFRWAGQVFGPTGGYLIGYIFLALIGGYFVEKFTGKLAMYFVGMVLGTIVLYAFGTAWLAFQTGMTFGAALMAGVIPYIPGDLVKIILAVLVGNEVRKRLMAANLV